ncbi:MAG TPA: hypothetical protein VGK57_17215 [Candidatus Binatia bacterium]
MTDVSAYTQGWNFYLAGRSRVTVASSALLVDYREISTIGCHVYACGIAVMIPASAETDSKP